MGEGSWRGTDFTVTDVKLGKPLCLPTRQTLQSTAQPDFPRALLVLKYKGRASMETSLHPLLEESLRLLSHFISLYQFISLKTCHVLTLSFSYSTFIKNNSDLLSLYPHPSVEQFPTTTLPASPVLSPTTHPRDTMLSKRDMDPALTPLTIEWANQPFHLQFLLFHSFF